MGDVFWGIWIWGGGLLVGGEKGFLCWPILTHFLILLKVWIIVIVWL